MGLTEHDFRMHSGERVTALVTDAIPPDHWARYAFACEVLADMPGTLVGADVFCGAGYGAHMLAQRLPCFLLAIDGSAESIHQASHHYVDVNLLFSHKLFPFSLPSGHFDFLVSMESIEHVENGELFFAVLAQALKPGGRLVISAPNAAVVDLAKNPYAWHHRHYLLDEMVALGRQHGLVHRKVMGADCTVVDAQGRVVAVNAFSPVGGMLREGHAGDTLTHVFGKPAA